MNFYEFYRLLNEYGQSTVDALIKKFTQEDKTLNPNTIRSYIDRFEKIKNNLPEKDITKYTWSELEMVVDGYQGNNRIKAGKLDPSVSDANLLYNKDGIRIYLGKDRKSCVKYGNGYTFCISARGENNMYARYRIDKRGTPYFIFNDNMPRSDNRHVIVLFVYPSKATSPQYYTITLADNRGDKKFKSLNDIIKNYPWVEGIKKWVDDSNEEKTPKGNIPVDPLEFVEHYLKDEYDRNKHMLISSWAHGDDVLSLEDLGLASDMLRKDTKDIEEFLSGRKNLANINIYLMLNDRHDPVEKIVDNQLELSIMNKIIMYYSRPEEVIKKIEKEIKESYVQVVDEVLYDTNYLSVEDFKKEFKQKENEIKKELVNNQSLALDSADLEKMKISGDFKSRYPGLIIMPYFIISLGTPNQQGKKILEERRGILNEILKLDNQYKRHISFINKSPEELLQKISEKILENGGFGEIDEYPSINIANVINSFMRSSNR